jgi:hypothetical protein
MVGSQSASVRETACTECNEKAPLADQQCRLKSFAAWRENFSFRQRGDAFQAFETGEIPDACRWHSG